MNVFRFDQDPGLLARFLDLPSRIHRGNPHWIPPFRESVRAQLKESAPFRQHGEMIHFVATEGKEPVARCAAVINRRYDEGLGFVGYFEAIDRYEASEAVLSAAVDWLQSKGVTIIRGPLNTSTYFPYRFMTEGFEHGAFFLEPYNPAHYPAHWERFGFRSCCSYMSAIVDSAACAAEIKREYDRSMAAGYRSRPFDRDRFEQELRLMYDLSSVIFRDSWMWKPISFEEFRGLYAGMKGIMDPELCHFLFEGETPVGFVFGLPDYGPAIRAMNGSQSPLAKLRFLMKRHETPVALLKTFGVVPGRRNGSLALALCYLMHEAAARKGYARTVHALMREDNTSLRMSRRFGGEVLKRYALYELQGGTSL